MPNVQRLSIAIALIAALACSRERGGSAANDTARGSAAAASTARATTASAGETASAAQSEPRISVPAGFHASYFAKGLSGVRMMIMGPDGAVYASQPGSGKVVRLVDANGDGVADSTVTVISALNRPHGLAFHGGYLYIANTDAVVRVRLGANGVAQGSPETLVRLTGGGVHFTRTIVFAPDSMMYVSVGSSCNVCVEQDSDRAAVSRFDANGKNGKIFSRGLRNAVGLAVRPGTDEVWATVNERDNLEPSHENLPPDKLVILRDGADFGWPYCYSAGGKIYPNPEFHDAARCANVVPNAMDIQAHSAALGIAFLANASQFPSDYQGDALIALHGSWNRDQPTGDKVIRVHIANGKPTTYDDFASGFQQANGYRWGRPVAVLVYRDGSVLVSDDLSGSIFRISH